MWNAFRADLNEFVSTVTEESSNVLSKIDAGMSDDGGKSDDDLDSDDGANAERLASDDEQQEEGAANKKEAAVDPTELNEILKLLRDHPGTFTEALTDEDNQEQVQAYLDSFSIDAKTDEISKHLKEYPQLQRNFEELCPTQVTYEDFWKRYFFRCDKDRIAQQLKEETERERQARAQAIQQGITTVTNFFGGAASALSKTLAPAMDGSGTAGGSNTATKSNFFGSKGRPPFVMNTAMDESGDDDIEGEDDEEELGWDDDDDDDDEEIEERRATEQIEFTDKVAEDLQQKLKQAVDERDQLQQTVHMQTEEIKALQTKASASGSASGGDLQAIQLKLFETEAELAALKARVDDDKLDGSDREDEGDKLVSLAQQLRKLPADQLSQLKDQVFGKDDKTASKNDDAQLQKLATLEKQVQDLTQTLSTKESEYDKVTEQLQSTSLELQQYQAKLNSDQANAESANATVSDLESQLNSVRDTVHQLQKENASLKETAESKEEQAKNQLSTLQQQHTDLQKQVTTLTQQLDQANAKLQQSEEARKKAEKDLEKVKQAATTPTTPTATAAASTPPPAAAATPALATPKSTTPPASAMKIDLDDDELEDDWGDDWD